MFKTILLRSSIATIVAWSGGATGAALGGAAKKHLTYFVTAALGALLAVTLLDILPDAQRLLSLPWFIFATVSGAALFWLVGQYIYPVCPACSSIDETPQPQIQLTRTVTLLAIALGIHSTMDGAAVVIGDTLAHGANAGVFFAVSLHKFPEGLALALLLIGAGLGRRKALLLTVAIEATTELGALGALLLVTRLPSSILGFIFANIGGGFLYLVASTLILETHQADIRGRTGRRLIAAATACVGFAATCTIMFFSHVLSR